MKLKKKYRVGFQWKTNKVKGSGDNPQNNPKTAKRKGRLGMNTPKGAGTGER